MKKSDLTNLIRECLTEVTRKDFVLMANAIKQIQDPVKRKEQAEVTAEVFAKQNPRFDKVRYMQACGVAQGVQVTENMGSDEFETKLGGKTVSIAYEPGRRGGEAMVTSVTDESGNDIYDSLSPDEQMEANRLAGEHMMDAGSYHADTRDNFREGKTMKKNELVELIRECLMEAKKKKGLPFPGAKPFKKKDKKSDKKEKSLKEAKQKDYIKEALKKMVQEEIEEYRTKGATGLKFRTAGVLDTNKMEEIIRGFISGTNPKIPQASLDQLEEIVTIFHIPTEDTHLMGDESEIAGAYFDGILKELEKKDEQFVKKLYDFIVVQKHWVKGDVPSVEPELQ